MNEKNYNHLNISISQKAFQLKLKAFSKIFKRFLLVRKKKANTSLGKRQKFGNNLSVCVLHKAPLKFSVFIFASFKKCLKKVKQ